MRERKSAVDLCALFESFFSAMRHAMAFDELTLPQRVCRRNHARLS